MLGSTASIATDRRRSHRAGPAMTAPREDRALAHRPRSDAGGGTSSAWARHRGHAEARPRSRRGEVAPRGEHDASREEQYIRDLDGGLHPDTAYPYPMDMDKLAPSPHDPRGRACTSRNLRSPRPAVRALRASMYARNTGRIPCNCWRSSSKTLHGAGSTLAVAGSRPTSA